MKVRLLRISLWAFYLVMCLAILGVGQFAAHKARPWMQSAISSWLEKEKPYCSPDRTINIEGCPDLIADGLPRPNPFDQFAEEQAFAEHAKRLIADREHQGQREAEAVEQKIAALAVEVAQELSVPEAAARHLVRVALTEQQRLEQRAAERARNLNMEFRVAYRMELTAWPARKQSNSHSTQSSATQIQGTEIWDVEAEYVSRLLRDRLLPEFMRFDGSALQASHIKE